MGGWYDPFNTRRETVPTSKCPMPTSSAEVFLLCVCHSFRARVNSENKSPSWDQKCIQYILKYCIKYLLCIYLSMYLKLLDLMESLGFALSSTHIMHHWKGELVLVCLLLNIWTGSIYGNNAVFSTHSIAFSIFEAKITAHSSFNGQFKMGNKIFRGPKDFVLSSADSYA